MTSPDVDVLVHLMFDEIIVTLPGTAYKVIYERIADPPGHCHVNRKFAGQMTMTATVHPATVAWRQVSIA